jgi:hypothetical protein
LKNVLKKFFEKSPSKNFFTQKFTKNLIQKKDSNNQYLKLEPLECRIRAAYPDQRRVLLTPLTTLETHGKASVSVVILADPVCFIFPIYFI